MSTKKPNTTIVQTSTSLAPDRLREFCEEQIPRAQRFTLVQQGVATMVVDSWGEEKGKLQPGTLAGWVWTRAIEDARTSKGTAYAVVVAPREGAEGARYGFAVPPPRTSEAGIVHYEANAQGVIAQTMASLATREQASHAMMSESVDAIFTLVRAHSADMKDARKTDGESYERVINGYKALLECEQESRRAETAGLRDQNAQLTKAFNEQALKVLEMIPTIEGLASAKHERDLATARQARSDARKDKLLSDAQDMVFPVIRAKLGGKLLAAAGVSAGATNGTSGTSGTNGKTNGASSAPAEEKNEHMKPQMTIFGPRALRAIEAFLHALDTEQAAEILDVLTPERQLLFREVGAALAAEMMELEAARAKANANGAAPAKGSPS